MFYIETDYCLEDDYCFEDLIAERDQMSTDEYNEIASILSARMYEEIANAENVDKKRRYS